MAEADKPLDLNTGIKEEDQEQENQNDVKKTPHHLAAIDDAKIGIYKSVLDDAFNNDKIKNIAITGPYGAGKSSILESYKKINPDKNFIHISLAHFASYTEKKNGIETQAEGQPTNGEEADENDKTEHQLNKAILEGKIINQLLHQIDPARIPQTKYQIKKRINKDNLHSIALFLSVFLLLCIYIFNFDRWSAFVLESMYLQNYIGFTTYRTFYVIICILIALMFNVILYKSIEAQQEKNILRKIKIKGHEVEVFSDDKDSSFDRSLNDVLYLFDRSGADAIVFDDIDRFDSTLVFEKLREINMLVNVKRMDRKERTLHFIYLIRDSLFLSKDRTKFFDIIVPVIPVMDSSNAYDKFLEELDSYGYKGIFKTSFLRSISLYIDEMRVLKNICFEFDIYKKRFDTKNLDMDKLLAVIVYKNLFPQDFNNLHTGKGYVATLFKMKEDFIKDKQAKTNTNKTALSNKIERINKEIFESEDEFFAAYLPLKYTDIIVKNLPQDQYENRTALMKVIRENGYKISCVEKGMRIPNKDVGSEFTEVRNENRERINTIKNKQNNRIEELQNDIVHHNELLEKLDQAKLHEIIDQDNENTIFEMKLIKDENKKDQICDILTDHYFQMLKYLIINGYLDESYADYMNYFYPNSLTFNDKKFVLSVVEKRSLGYKYKIEKPEVVFENFSLVDFSKEVILNYDFVAYIVDMKHPSQECNSIFKRIIKSKNLDFIQGYIKTKHNMKPFLEILCNLWNDCSDEILTSSLIDVRFMHEYIVLLLIHCSVSLIKAQNKDNCIIRFINTCPYFLNIECPDTDTFIYKIDELDVRFEALDVSQADKTLLKAVYNENLYSLNKHMIETFLQYDYDVVENENLISQGYSLISSKKSSLKTYIDKNISKYLDVVINNSETISDIESIAVDIMNHKALRQEQKQSYLKKLDIQFKDITKIGTMFWSDLLKEQKVVYSIVNVLHYYVSADNTFTEPLLSYIESQKNKIEISKAVLDRVFGRDFSNSLFRNIINCLEFPLFQYQEYLSKLGFRLGTFKFDSISDEQMIILIRINVITMNAKNLEFVRKNYPDHLIDYIVKNIRTYNKIMNKSIFDEEEFLELVNSNKVQNYIRYLIKYAEKPIDLTAINPTEAVLHWILKHLFLTSNLPLVLEKYEEYSEKNRKEVARIVKEEIDSTLENQYQLPNDVLFSVFDAPNINMDKKMKVLAYHTSQLEKGDMIRALKVLGQDRFLCLFEGKRPYIQKTTANGNLLEALKQKGWISSYTSDYSKKYFQAFSKRKWD